MKSSITTLSYYLSIFSTIFTTIPAIAQPITPANDGTNTRIIPQSNIFNINGGTLSTDKTNLFHSFDKFGLSTGQTANFISKPEIHNILGRITGGNSSLINGLIQVTGGNSNLFLMNPAGIVFGSNASLNVPASFTATTAIGIGFSNNNWFNAFGSNNYNNLIGIPNKFNFNLSQPGNIINAGNLTVTPGQNLTLIGGSVINTGQINAPTGNINITAVPGQNIVKISQPGNILSLEIAPPTTATGEILPFKPLDLPTLLTGTANNIETGLNLTTTRGIQLSKSGVNIPNQTGVNIVSGNLNTQGETGGNIQILGNKIGIIGSNINATGNNGGGSVFIGGDFQGKGSLPNATHTFVSNDSVINADAINQGNGGKIIIWADKTTRFFGNITAKGGVFAGDGGFVEVSGKEFLDFQGNVNTLAVNGKTGTLLLDPTNINVTIPPTFVSNFATSLTQVDQFSDVDIYIPTSTSYVPPSLINNATSNVILQATNNIEFNSPVNISNSGVGLTAQAGNTITVGSSITTNRGNIDFLAGNAIIIGVFGGNPTITTNGGNANFKAVNNINIAGNSIITTNSGNLNISADSNNNGSGSLLLSSSSIITGGGNITLSGNSNTLSGIIITGGTLNSGGGNINTTGNSTDSRSPGFFYNSGNIISAGGNINITGNNNNDTGIVGFGNITSGGGNITLNGTGNTGIGVGNGTINSGGGSITMTGNSSSVSGISMGSPLISSGGNITLIGNNNSSSISGIGISNSINSGNGSIAITGNNTGSGNAISFISPITSTKGNITLTGISQSGTGIFGNSSIASDSGNINLIGNSINGNGINIIGNITSNTGNITLTGNSTTNGLIVGNTIKTGTGDITLTADLIDLASTGTPSVTSSGNLTIQPLNPNSNMTLGGTGSASTTFLNTPEIGNITSGFNSITIGRADSSGSINLNSNIIFNNPVTLRSPANTGNINTTGFSINGAGNATINLLANHNITTGSINNPGRSITITSTTGQINTTAGTINTSSDSGNGGDINLSAPANNITTANINSNSTNNTSGNINLNSGAVINTITGTINASSPSGQGGNITLNAATNINTSLIDSSALNGKNGGNITINTSGGSININSVNSQGNAGNGGNISLSAASNINTGILSADSINNGNGGAINITSNTGNITTNLIDSNAITGNGGNISLNAAGNINTNNINANSYRQGNGGNVNINSQIGSITTGEINTTAKTGNSGTIALNASSNITTNNITSTAITYGNGNNIKIISTTGGITTGNLFSFGAINGGNIEVQAKTQITALKLDSTGNIGTGGNVLLDPIGDIQVSDIKTVGGITGGNVDITTGQFFRATGTFNTSNCSNASICTFGGNSGGNIIIRHGGNGITPFIVTNATTNGTAGIITKGNTPPETIANGSFPYTYTQDNGKIAIVSVPQPNTPIINEPKPNEPSINNPIINNPNNPIINNPNNPIINNPSNPNTSQSNQISIKDIDLIQPQGKPNIMGVNQKDTVQIWEMDSLFKQDYVNYFKLRENPGIALNELRDVLKNIESSVGIKPAIIYAVFVPETITPVTTASSITTAGEKGDVLPPLLRALNREKSDRLELILVTSEGKPIRKSVNTNRAEVIAAAEEFRKNISSRQKYLTSAQKMYQFLLQPLETELQQQNIQNLVYIPDVNLRTLPLAAMHDTKGFIIERYSIGMMPSISLTDLRPNNIRNSQVLVMGASEFIDQASLPGVPQEVSLVKETWGGKSFLNAEFTLEQLKAQRDKIPFGIVHLATHADFVKGEPQNSYIQFVNQKLPLPNLRSVNFSNPPVELLVLSACNTALGDEDVELGFAGLAIQVGVKSALASLWSVSDEGTLGLMSEFYQQLKTAPIKAEALRRAQLAMIRGQVRLENGLLIINEGKIPLSSELVKLGNINLNHPYYWSSFTIIGNPW